MSVCLLKNPLVWYEWRNHGLSTVLETSLEKGSFACSVTNALIVSGLSSSALPDIFNTSWKAGFIESKLLLTGSVGYIFAHVSVFSLLEGSLDIIDTGTLSSIGDSSTAVFWQAGWWVGCRMFYAGLMNNFKIRFWQSDSIRRHLASFSVVSVMFNNHRSTSWSVQIVNENPWGMVSTGEELTRQRELLYELHWNPLQSCLTILSSTLWAFVAIKPFL